MSEAPSETRTASIKAMGSITSCEDVIGSRWGPCLVEPWVTPRSDARRGRPPPRDTAGDSGVGRSQPMIDGW